MSEELIQLNVLSVSPTMWLYIWDFFRTAATCSIVVCINWQTGHLKAQIFPNCCHSLDVMRKIGLLEIFVTGSLYQILLRSVWGP